MSTEEEKSAPIQPKYTAIISDMHLTEAEPDRPEGDLWKKFKTRQFFYDDVLESFMDHIQQMSEGAPVELILNGDVFDFDSVTEIPQDAPYRISWIERRRGLYSEEAKSSFKIRKILKEHDVFVKALSQFIKKGNTVVIVTGNHDLELLYPQVQKDILESLDLTPEETQRVRFCEWFYISNEDTLIEHGNQYDPYCVCQDPINPLIQKFNRIELRIPFGNLATRYLINGMGFFNPNVESNFIMSFGDYMKFFFKYLMRTQPLIMWTWFWSSILILIQSSVDRLLPELKDPLTLEDKVNEIARKSNATPRMVRELKEMTVHPAASNPLRIARELWLDRAFLVLLAFLFIFQIFTFIKLAYDLSFFWMFIPLFMALPFFIFYAKSIRSDVSTVKEPDEYILSVTAKITRVQRIVYGHTHVSRHEMVGMVEHLNCGTWSPAFLDVECTKPFGKKTYVWIEPSGESRVAQLREFVRGDSRQTQGDPTQSAPTPVSISN